MFKRDAISIALVVIAIGILGVGFYALGTLIVIKYLGGKVTAIVTAVPTSCDKYNHIDVRIGDSVYEVSINRGECRKGNYKVGQQVELMRHPRHKDLVWPDSSPELAAGLTLLVFGYVYYEYRSRRRKKDSTHMS